ncbi:hypothetical protein BGX28_006025 [Mortierella sp. GBA30]|nr:hypothetical protein BGX28_006025 [Mortierella sp. GBA30]
MTSGQQNTFESNTFSILELSKILSPTVDNASGQQIILSVPVLLASFGIDDPQSQSASIFGISATCVLTSAPHQIYVGGNFKQIPSAPVSTSSNGTTIISNNGSTVLTSSTDSRMGLNYVGVYDSKLKRFLAMENGLDGPVQNLMCDSSTDQVYVVGQFRAPLQDDLLSGGASISNESQYQTLGLFGGGVAVWKRSPDSDIGSGGSSENDNQLPLPTQASGSWTSVPFKGVNGVVTSVAKTQDGTFYFGGQFDTTTDGEQFSAPDTQPVNLDSVQVTTGNGIDVNQDRSIICQNTTGTHSNWIMRDNIPGYWRAQFPLLITPTLFRLWNVDTDQSPESANRGTKTFSIMAQPSNQPLNLSYIEPITHAVYYCTVCPLLSTASLHSPGKYQDFMVVKPVLLNAVQINVVSWYGLGGGLGGLEVYQAEIFVRAVDDLNIASKCTSSAGSNTTEANTRNNRDLTAYSRVSGANWVSMKMQDGWQTVMAASISPSDARQQAYVDMSPYLQEEGMYNVYLYTPACSSSKATAASSSMPSNACADRGYVDVTMYFGSPQSAITVTLAQTNTADKYEKIYSGMIVRSTPDFRPHVIISPSVAETGTSGGGATQTVVVDSIQFVKEATLNNTNSLIYYRPGAQQGARGQGRVAKNIVEAVDSSTWGNLPTQLPSGSLVNALVAYSGSFRSSSSASSSILFIGGEFQGPGFSNVVAWDGTKFVYLGQQVASASGLDGAVADMVLEQSTLYMVGNFQQSYSSSGTGVVPLLGGLGLYNVQTDTWSSFGNISQNFQPGAKFQTIELSTGADGQAQLVIGGTFTWVGDMKSHSVAIWDLNTQQWIREDPSSKSTTTNGFPFGFMRGQISYLSRILGSSIDGSTSRKDPVTLVAGMIDSIDTYQVQQPENMSWLTETGKLRTFNLSPALPEASAVNDTSTVGTQRIDQVTTLKRTNAGVMYRNPSSQQWVTIVGGSKVDGTIGVGFFDSSQDNADTFGYRELNLAATYTSPIAGEVLALGIDKYESTGMGTTSSGNDLLLIGGAFKSSSGDGSSGLNALAIYDLASDQAVPVTLMPAMRGVSGTGGRDPAIHVIKSRPADSKGTLILAGDFSGVGSSVNCELICLWEPVEARNALDRRNSLESSFKSIYGDNGGDKKHLGVLRGVINDIAFEDDSNMFIAGDLIVNGVPCGVASFNFDSAQWTTFGSIMSATTNSGSTVHPGPNMLPGPATAIAHDSILHQFFVAGHDNSDLIIDTTDIIEQGFILLVSGRIVLGNPSTAFPMSRSIDRQESSRNSSSSFLNGPSTGGPAIGPATPVTTNIGQNNVLSKRQLLSSDDIFERADPLISISSAVLTTIPIRVRDQGVFRALAIAHLPRIIAREYLSLTLVIIISMAISLGLIMLIILFGFLFVWMKRRLSGEERNQRPRLATSYMENGSSSLYGPGGLHATDSSLGLGQGAAYAAGDSSSIDGKRSVGAMSFFRRRPKGGNKGPESTEALMASLGITNALEVAASRPHRSQSIIQPVRPLIYRPNSTIAEATGALVTEFVRSHQQQLAGGLGRSNSATLHQAIGRPSIEEISQYPQDTQTPPSPDRRSKQSLPSYSFQQTPSHEKGRDSSSSDLLNPITQGRFASLLAAADTTSQDPTTPLSHAPTSPVTTMSTPGGVPGTSGTNLADVNPSGSGAIYYAKFPFRAREIGELGFKAGERILVVDMSDDIWWMGVIQDANGQQTHGVFPSNYVGLTP